VKRFPPARAFGWSGLIAILLISALAGDSAAQRLSENTIAQRGDPAPCTQGGATTSAARSVPLRGVHFVSNLGQWADQAAVYGFRSRDMEIAFRESSFTMYLQREGIDANRDDQESAFTNKSIANWDRSPDQRSLDRRGPRNEPAGRETLALEVTFPGSNAVGPVGVRPQATRFN
jgi:hypothetical protein